MAGNIKNKKKRTASANRPAAGAKPQADRSGEITLKEEVILWLILAFAILLFISNLGFGGFVGDAVSVCLFGILGFPAHIFPLALVFVSAFLLSNKKNPTAWMKAGLMAVFWLCFCALSELITNGNDFTRNFKDFYTASAEFRTGGGVVGGFLYKLVGLGLGLPGSYVVFLAVSIVCFVLLTEKSLFMGMKRGGSKVYHSAKRDAKVRREKASIRREQKLLEQEKQQARERLLLQKDQEEFWQMQQGPRMDRKVSGVTWDTRIEVPKEEPISIEWNEEEKEFEQEEFIEIPVSEAEPIPAAKNPKTPKKEQEASIQEVAMEIEKAVLEQQPKYAFPSMNLLKKSRKGRQGDRNKELRDTAMKLQNTLHDFGVEVNVTNVSCGPAVTRYELTPKQGVKVSRIVSLSDDIKLNLAAADIRIEAPIPGKPAVGIEVPNKENQPVMLRELLETKEFREHPSDLAFAAGKDIAGKAVVTDIARMPHLLIAGATGSGKSVCINTIIMSILYKAKPEDVKLIMIDPKVVELSVYNGIPHLFIPVVTDPKKAAGALNWGVAEMMERYKKFANCNVRDLKGYNEKIENLKEIEGEDKPEKLPQIVIIVDELADLMMVAPGEVEDAICRLAQLARAAGIHLIIATQRPSVNVITGLIKANMPSRIAFAVSSGVDSRTIIDMNGAEKLLGKGDMLFYPQGYQKPVRVQGAFVSDSEVAAVVKFLSKENNCAPYSHEVEEQISKVQQLSETPPGGDIDVHFAEAAKFIIEKDKASIGMLQRVFKIGFNRAARLMDQLADAGVVGPEEGTKPRKVLMTIEEFEQYIEEQG